jgi:hypothetical protein
MITEEEHIDLIVLLATFKSFNEQLYNMKGKHKNQTKMWFNRLLNTARSYENSIKQKTNVIDDKNLEVVYDAITDLIYTIKDNTINKLKEEGKDYERTLEETI